MITNRINTKTDKRLIIRSETHKDYKYIASLGLHSFQDGTNTEIKERPRIDYFDIAKAITIFLVVVGHFAPFSIDNPFYKIVLYAFHMPLFFMVSGVFVRRHQTSGYGLAHWKDFLRKNIMALLVPYFIWALIFSKFSFPNIPYILYGTDASLERAGSAPSLWFLPCLFVARTLMELILMSSKHFQKINRHLYAAGFAVLAFVIAFLLPPLEMSYPWGLNSAIAGLGFMLTGYAIKEFMDKFQHKKIWWHLLAITVSASIFVFGITIQGANPDFVMMFAGEYGNPILFIINAFSGCGIIISFSVILTKLWEKHSKSKVRKFTIWLGQNTIGVFLLHFPIVHELIGPTLVSCLGMNVANLWTALLAALITLIICCPIVLAVNRYLPVLFGK